MNARNAAATTVINAGNDRARRVEPWFKNLLSVAGFAVSLFGATALAQTGTKPAEKPAEKQADKQAEAQPGKVQTLMVAERSDLSKLLVDPRDMRLAKSLGMLPARLAELPAESPNFPPQAAAAIKTALSAFARPGRFGVTVNAGDPSNGLFGYGVVISAVAADQKDAESLHASIRDMLKDAPVPPAPAGPKRFESMDDTIVGPAGRLSYGPRHTVDGWRYEVILGTLDDPDQAWLNLPKPTIEGLSPVLVGNFDFSGLTPAVNMVAAFAGPQNPEIKRAISEAGKAGFYGPNAMKANFEYGYTATESRARITIDGAVKFKDKLNLSTTALTSEEFSAVPADATMASVSKGDLAMFDTLITQMTERNPETANGLKQFKDATGVDLQNDVIKTLGGTFAYYLSDATGGGTIGSAVAMISYKDRAKFLEAHAKLLKFANNALQQAPDIGKYIRVQPWVEDGIELLSLRASGLPLPLELTYVATEKWLIAGLTPQATIAAVKQAMGKGDKGLTSNAMFALQTKGKSLISATFMDSARFAHAGYPIISMIGSAISSGVRSPAFTAGPARDAGMVVPTFADLTRELRPSAMISYWKGDSYVIDGYGDRSVIASAAGASGLFAQFAPIIALPLAGAAAQKQGRDLQGMAPAWDHIPIADAAGWMMREPLTAPMALLAGSRMLEHAFTLDQR